MVLSGAIARTFRRSSAAGPDRPTPSKLIPLRRRLPDRTDYPQQGFTRQQDTTGTPKYSGSLNDFPRLTAAIGLSLFQNLKLKGHMTDIELFFE